MKTVLPLRRQVICIVVVLPLLHAVTAPGQQPIPVATVSRTTAVSFEQEILPVFRRSCLACHGASEAYGELVLESPKGILAGGDSGPAVVAGKGAESLLLKVAAHQEEPLMPPPDNDVAAPKLTSQELGLIKLWIDQGAKGSATAEVISPERWRPLPPGNHPIYSVAVTPDGQFAACSRANQIFIYHVPTGRLITRLSDPGLQATGTDKRPGIAHLDVVQSLAFNKQGDLLASGGFRTVKLWRYPRDVRRLTLDAATGSVTALAVSPDRKTLAVGADDNAIKLWNLETGAELRSISGHSAAVTGMQFSHDGQRLYSSSADRTIRVWSLADGSLAGRIDTPTEVAALTTLVEKVPPSESAAAPDAPADDSAPTEQQPVDTAVIERIATGGGDNLIRIWNVPEGLPEPLADVPPNVQVLAVSADRQVLAMGTAEGLVRVVSAADGETIHQWQAHESAINGLAFRPVIEPEAAAETAAPVAETSEPTAETAEPAEAPAAIRLATAGADGSVRIWNSATGESVTILRGGAGSVESIAFRPDGKQVVAGVADGKATVWNLDVDPPRPLTGDNGGPAAVAVVSPDGKLLATGGMSNGRPAVFVRDLNESNTIHTLLGHTGPITALAFHPDGARLVSGSADKTARVWNLADAKFPELASFTGHGAVVAAVGFNADGQQVLSAASDNSLKLWSVADGAEVTSFAGHTAAVVSVAMTSAGQPVSASADKTIRVWNPADGQVVRTITDAAAVTAMTLSRDSARVAVAGADNNVRIYQLADGALQHSLSGHQDVVESLAFSADGTRLLSGGADDLAMVWSAADGRLLEVLSVEGGLASATYGPANDTVVLNNQAGGLQVHTLRFASALPGMTAEVTAAAFSPDGQTIYASCADGTLRAFAAETGEQKFAANHAAAVHDLALSPNGQRLATAGEDKTVKLWEAATGTPAQPPQLTGFTAAVGAVGFTADNERIIAGSAAGEVRIFNLAAGGAFEQSIVGHGGAVHSLAVVDEAASRALSASADGAVLGWQLSAERQIAGHTQPVTSLAPVPDQPQQLLSGSLDGTLRRWNLSDGSQLAQLTHGGPVTSVAVRGDGQRFASAGANNTAKLWNAADGGQLAEMRGDIRAITRVAKLTQQKNSATAKVTAAKAALETAEKDVPAKTTAEKTAAEAVAAARTDMQAKTTTLTTASTAKSTAESNAIQAAAAAQQAAREMDKANQLALSLAAKAQMLAERVAQAQAAAQAEPDNQSLAQAAAQASQTAGAADAEAKAAESAKAAPTQKATTAAQAATTAANSAIAMSQPFNQADTALSEAKSKLQAAQLAHEVARRDLQFAQQQVPAAKTELEKAEATLKQIETQLAVATQAATDAQQPFRAVAFSPDGRTLATGGDFGVVHSWDAETGKALGSYVGHDAAVTALTYVSAAELASGSTDKSAGVWDLNPGWQLERVIGNIGDPSTLVDRVVALDFSPDGQLLTTGGGVPSRGGEIKIWAVADGTLVRDLSEPHTDGVNAVAFSPDGEFLASAGADRYVKKFSVATGELLQQFEGHTNHVLGVSWRGNGRVLASCGAGGTIRLWDATTGDRIRAIQGYQKQVTSLRFIGQSQFLMAVSGDPLVRMHNADNGAVQRNFAGADDYQYAVAVTPDPNNGVVVAGGHDGGLRIWNTANGQALHDLKPPQEEAVAKE